MVKRVSICLLGIVGLVFGLSCGSTTGSNSATSNQSARTGNTTSNAGSQTGGNSSVASAPADRKAEFTTTPEALLKEYKSGLSSMEKYKGKVVEISGKFSRNAGSEDALEIKFEPDTPAGNVVTCRINATAVQTAAKLQKGQEIKMTGIGATDSIIGPAFNDCQMAQ